MKVLTSALFFLLAVANTTLAQTISYSPYSHYGIGILKERTSSMNRSLSETGIGLRDNFNLNNLNPASYSSIQGVTQVTEMGMFYETGRLETNQETRPYGNGNITSINFWFRLSKKWGSTIGLTPFSIVNYNIVEQREFIEGETSFVNYTGKGGLTQFYWGNGFQITKNLSVGANLSFVFGSLRKEESIIAGRSAGLNVRNNTYLNKFNIEWGAQYLVRLSETRTASIGVTYTNQSRFNTSGEQSVYALFGRDSLYTKDLDVDDYVMPAQYGVGVAFQSPRTTVAIDYKFKNWEQARLENNATFQNTHRLSMGYEYKGNPNSDKYWNFIVFRTGFYAQNNYLNLDGKPSFNESGFTVGMGLPMSRSRNMINLSYNLSNMGTTDKGLILQQSRILVIDVVFRDLWGVRRKFD